jgi:hypothetical protein
LQSDALVFLLRSRVRDADFVSDPPGFFFERTDGEFGARVTVAKILLNEGLKAATSLTLSDVHELVQDQLTIPPAIGANDDPVTDCHAARSLGDNISLLCDLSELLIVRQRNVMDYQDFDTGTIMNTDSTRVGSVPWP